MGKQNIQAKKVYFFLRISNIISQCEQKEKKKLAQFKN